MSLALCKSNGRNRTPGMLTTTALRLALLPAFLFLFVQLALSCTTNYTNTSWSNYTDVGSCFEFQQLQTRYLISYDQNSCDLNNTIFRPADYDILGGTLTAGNLTSLQYADGDIFIIRESPTSPNIQVNISYDNVNHSPTQVDAYLYYDGGETEDDIYLEIYDYNLSAWVEQTHFIVTDSYQWINISFNGSNYWQSNLTQLRFSHTGAGNPTHYLYIDTVLLGTSSNITYTDYSYYACNNVGNLQSGLVVMPVFLILAALALLLFVGGYLADAPFLAVIGLFLWFLCGFIIEAGNLGVVAGETATIDGNTTVTTIDYEGWEGANHHLVGWGLMVVSIVMFALLMFSLGGEYD